MRLPAKGEVQEIGTDTVPRGTSFYLLFDTIEKRRVSGTASEAEKIATKQSHRRPPPIQTPESPVPLLGSEVAGYGRLAPVPPKRVHDRHGRSSRS